MTKVKPESKWTKHIKTWQDYIQIYLWLSVSEACHGMPRVPSTPRMKGFLQFVPSLLIPECVAKGSRFTLGSGGGGVFAWCRFGVRNCLRTTVVAVKLPCLWGKLQKVLFPKESQKLVVLFCVAGVVLCDIRRVSGGMCVHHRGGTKVVVSILEAAKTCLFQGGHRSLHVVFACKAWHFVNFDSVSEGMCVRDRRGSRKLQKLSFSTLYTPHFHSTLHTHTLHPALYIQTFLFSLYTPLSTLCTLHFRLRTLHSSLCTLHFILHTLLHSTFHTLHSFLHTLHSTLCTPHSTLYTPPSTLASHSTHCMLHLTLYFFHAPHLALQRLPLSTAYSALVQNLVSKLCFTKVFYVTAFGFVGFLPVVPHKAVAEVSE